MCTILQFLLLFSANSFPITINSQPGSKHPKANDEIRPLQWGELNFLHTTDTHGWLAGHILEGEFSGDWGDFVSFRTRMEEIAASKNVDIVTIDSGDRHDGNGLSDASKHDGSLSLPIFCEVSYDLVTIGNHELYRGETSIQEFDEVRSHFGDRYVVSNVELLRDGAWHPMGNKYRIFTTKNRAFRVLGLGFLFDFEGNDKNVSKVTKVSEEVQKEWFTTLMTEELPYVDYVVVAGHIPLRESTEFETILHKIREFNSTIPVTIFGGHSHIRDYRVYDNSAVAIQSGRYVETLGFSSVNFTNIESPSFSRSYIDFNERNMAFHSGELPKTLHGIAVSKHIAKVRASLNLDEFRAIIPKTYYTDRAPFPSENSVYSLLQDHVIPLLSSPKEIQNDTRYIIVNTGSIRFDLFKGPYTKDTGYILSPFHNQWLYIRDIPRDIADQVLPLINGEHQVTGSRFTNTASNHELFETNWWVQQMNRLLQSLSIFQATRKHKSAGYKTIDDIGSFGDDTDHEAWKFYPIPQAFQTLIEKNSTNVTLIFQDYVGWFIERAFAQLNQKELYRPQFHGGEEVIDLVPRYFNQR